MKKGTITQILSLVQNTVTNGDKQKQMYTKR